MANHITTALAFLAGYGLRTLQQRIHRHLRSMGPPRGSYGLPSSDDWRRSCNHENTNRPTCERPLRFERTVRFDPPLK